MQPHQFTHHEVKLVAVTSDNKAVYYANRELKTSYLQTDTEGRLLFIHEQKGYQLPKEFQPRLN